MSVFVILVQAREHRENSICKGTEAVTLVTPRVEDTGTWALWMPRHIDGKLRRKCPRLSEHLMTTRECKGRLILSQQTLLCKSLTPFVVSLPTTEAQSINCQAVNKNLH